MSFENREKQEKQFLNDKLIKLLIRHGFEFRLFSIGAKPDGFYVTAHAFDKISDEIGNPIQLKFTGKSLDDAFSKMISASKVEKHGVGDYLYKELKKLASSYMPKETISRTQLKKLIKEVVSVLQEGTFTDVFYPVIYREDEPIKLKVKVSCYKGTNSDDNPDEIEILDVKDANGAPFELSASEDEDIQNQFVEHQEEQRNDDELRWSGRGGEDYS